MNISQNVKKKFQSIKIVNDWYTKKKWRQKKASYGEEHPEHTFYVIRRATCKVGLFSHVTTNLGQIEYALSKGYIPVIDMKNNANTYLEEEQIGKVNAWEFYFKQPCAYSLEDIARSKNIILGNGLITEDNEYPGFTMLHDSREFKRWHDLSQKYLMVNDNIRQEAGGLFQKMFGQERVLGVLCRGTDYIRSKPKGHPVQPTPEQITEKAEEMMRRTNCRWIYLATEDEQYYQSFLKKFGASLKVSDAKRCTKEGQFNINDISYNRPNDRYLKGKDYLINILLLAKCNCLLAGAAGGTYGALLLNEGYEEKYIFDLGLY